MTKAHELLRELTYKAVALLETIVDDTAAAYPVRMQAAQMILERTLPKTSEKITVQLGNEPEPLYKRRALTAIRPIEIGPRSLADDPTITNDA